MTYPMVEKYKEMLLGKDFGPLLEQAITMPAKAKANDIRINCVQIKEDADKFERFNIDWKALIAELEEFAQLLEETEALFNNFYSINRTADEIWSQHKPALYDWRAEVFARLTYINFLNPDGDLTRSLRRISEGEGHIDTLQDVFQCFGLIDLHFSTLAENGLTQEAVVNAREIYETTAKVYPEVLAAESDLEKAKELRNRAFWHLHSLEKRLKEGHLKFVLFNDTKRRREYGSNYVRQSRKKK